MNQRMSHAMTVPAILVAAALAVAAPAVAAAEKIQRKPPAAPDRVSVTLDTGDELHFVRPDQVDRVSLVLRNKSGQQIRAELSLRVKERSSHPATSRRRARSTSPQEARCGGPCRRA